MSVPLKSKFPHPLCHNADCFCDSTSENIPPYDIQNQDILFPDSIMLQQLSLQAIHGICAFKWFCACFVKSWNAHYIFKLLRVFLRSGDNLKFTSKNTWFWNMTVIWGQNARKLQHNILMNIYEHPPGLPVPHASSLSMYLCLHGVCVCVLGRWRWGRTILSPPLAERPSMLSSNFYVLPPFYEPWLWLIFGPWQ